MIQFVKFDSNTLRVVDTKQCLSRVEAITKFQDTIQNLMRQGWVIRHHTLDSFYASKGSAVYKYWIADWVEG